MAGTTITNLTVAMNAGDVCTLEIPMSEENMGGYWPTNEEGYTNGFKLSNSNVGSILKVYTDKVAIDYQHKANTDNVIEFKSMFGDTLRILIGNVIVHDHASIRTGGPAYGTYFSDVEVEDV